MKKFLFLMLAVIYLSSCSDESIESLTVKAKAGDAVAQYQLGYEYNYSWDFEVQDDKLAFYWYEKSALQGHSDAAVELGNLYETGQGISVNNKLAVHWYKKAAEKENRNGQARLAYMYEYGMGIEKDLEKALLYYQKAADQGQKFAKTQVFMLKGKTGSASN